MHVPLKPCFAYFLNLHFLNFVLSHMSHKWKPHKKSLWHQSSYLIASNDKYLPLCKLILYVQLFSSGGNLIVYLIVSLVLTWILCRTHSIFITAIILSHSTLDNISERLFKVTQYIQRATFVTKTFPHLNKRFPKNQTFPKNESKFLKCAWDILKNRFSINVN